MTFVSALVVVALLGESSLVVGGACRHNARWSTMVKAALFLMEPAARVINANIANSTISTKVAMVSKTPYYIIAMKSEALRHRYHDHSS